MGRSRFFLFAPRLVWFEGALGVCLSKLRSVWLSMLAEAWTSLCYTLTDFFLWCVLCNGQNFRLCLRCTTCADWKKKHHKITTDRNIRLSSYNIARCMYRVEVICFLSLSLYSITRYSISVLILVCWTSHYSRTPSRARPRVVGVDGGKNERLMELSIQRRRAI